MSFEGYREPARVTRCEKTPLGLEVDVNDNGTLYTVRTNDPEGALIVVSGSSTRGLPSIDELSPETLRTIRRSLTTLTAIA